MILWDYLLKGEDGSVPRVGGGDPFAQSLATLNLKCSPRRRG